MEFLSFLHFSIIDLLDILLIAAVLYLLFKWIKGSSARNAFIAIIFLLIVRILAAALGMKMTSSLLDTVIDVGAIALIVIFQPEIRRFLNGVGRKAGSTLDKNSIIRKLLFNRDADHTSNPSINEIVQACMAMGEQKTGALIVLRRRDRLDDIISTGDTIDANICCRLIMNIFFKNSPLHDGAMVIGDNRIIAARCTLPITDRSDIPASYGMRHKAALGIGEQSDADVIVVSEETGNISFVRNGKVTKIDSANTLKLLLSERSQA